MALKPIHGLHHHKHDIVLTERTLGSFPRVASWDALLRCKEDSIYLLADTPLPELSGVKDWASGITRPFTSAAVMNGSAPLNDLLVGQPYCLHLHDALLLPPWARRVSRDALGQPSHAGMNMLYTARHELLTDSYFRYKSLSDRLVPDGDARWRLPAPRRVDVIDEPCVFVELIMGHFGHALLEGLARLWPYACQNGLRPSDFLFVGFGTHGLAKPDAVLPRWLDQIFRAIGIDPSRQIRFIKSPTKCFSLLVPKRISPYYQRPGIEFANLGAEVGRRLAVSVLCNRDVGKMFLSRSRLPTEKRGLIGSQSERLDSLFVELGYTIIHSQDLTLSEQVALVRSATHICGCAGSQLHLTMFCDNPPPPLLKITTQNFNNPTDSLIYWPKNGRVDEYVVPQPSERLQQPRNKAGWRLRPADFERLPVVIKQWEAEVLVLGAE